jgi:hypothetical protein
MHADGYSSILLECSECGALLKLNHFTLETVHGPVPDAFLAHGFLDRGETTEMSRVKRVQGLIDTRNALMAR